MNNFFKKRTILIVLSLITGLLFVCPQANHVLASQDKNVREPSIAIVGGTPYNMRDMVGIGQLELKKEFNVIVKKMSDENLLHWLKHGIVLPDEHLKTLTTRSSMEKALWVGVRNQVLDHTLKLLVLSRITDRIINEHGFAIEEYFNSASLKEALNRQIEYIEFRYAHQHKPKERDVESFKEAVKLFRFARPQVYWTETADEFRYRPSFMRWQSLSLKQSQKQGDYVLKAMIAHDLLKDACESPNGIYYERGREYFLYTMSVLKVIDIENYNGGRKVLEDYLNDVIDKEGVVTLGGISELQLWLRSLGSSVRLSQRNALGSVLSTSYTLPVLGRLYEPEPGIYRVVAREKAAADSDKDAAELALFYKLHAYKIAVQELLPKVESLADDWTPNVELAASALPVSGVNWVIPEVEIDPYIKKVYSGDNFRDIELHRPSLHEYAVSAANVIIQRDKIQAQLLIDTLTAKSQEAKTEPVRKNYKALSKRLSDKLILPATP